MESGPTRAHGRSRGSDIGEGSSDGVRQVVPGQQAVPLAGEERRDLQDQEAHRRQGAHRLHAGGGRAQLVGLRPPLRPLADAPSPARRRQLPQRRQGDLLRRHAPPRLGQGVGRLGGVAVRSRPQPLAARAVHDQPEEFVRRRHVRQLRVRRRGRFADRDRGRSGVLELRGAVQPGERGVGGSAEHAPEEKKLRGLLHGRQVLRHRRKERPRRRAHLRRGLRRGAQHVGADPAHAGARAGAGSAPPRGSEQRALLSGRLHQPTQGVRQEKQQLEEPRSRTGDSGVRGWMGRGV